MITCDCGSPLEYVCNTCGESLCATCKETHLQNKNTRHHSMTKYAKKPVPGSLSSPPCHDHDGKQCVYWCKTCDRAACVDCVIKSHFGHEFNELENVLQEKRISLQKELLYLESNIPKWKYQLIKARKVTSDFLDEVNGIDKELDGRAIECHKLVEEILAEYKKQVNAFKTSNLAILHEQEKLVSDGLEKAKQEIKECEYRLRSSDMESLLKYEVADYYKKDILPTICCVSPPVLTQSLIDTKSVTEMFGQLNVREADHGVGGSGELCIMIQVMYYSVQFIDSRIIMYFCTVGIHGLCI